MPDTGGNVAALEECRSAMEGAAGPVGAIGDEFENKPAAAGIFGELDAAAGMAAAIGELDGEAKRQFDAAERLLRGVSGALDAVRRGVEEVDGANADSMRI
ncbi:hypothetical protein ACL03H_14605 [Saccharopolyspora sp. MS10]|uniref:hypothetical protein n=1 Tax=Saccharopolyspora sp. MS10 TaxID=3385973 RepID=UPI0039A09BDB